MIERARAAEPAAAPPRHVALVMDGTESWARERGRTGVEADAAAAAALLRAALAAARHGVEVLTVHARSENIATALANAATKLHRANVRLNVLGRIARAPHAVRGALAQAVAQTAACDGLRLNFAVNYSARAELCEAVRALATDVRAGRLALAQIDDDVLASYLYTRDMPDPDLLIRTGGPPRLSNFLLYQIAYSELWSTPVLWPDFDARDFAAALQAFAGRQRRFGS